jgi:tetratricopeptide (TPR) repeat protein
VNRVPREEHFSALARRSFLRGCCGAAGALLLPAAPTVGSEFHLHPKYLEKTPLEKALADIKPGPDGFIHEHYHDQLAPLLAQWRSDLLQAPSQIEAITQCLGEAFSGSGWQPVERRLLRKSRSGIEVARVVYSPVEALDKIAFAGDLRHYLAAFSTILTADFQIVGLSGDYLALATDVRYEFVGAGNGYFREQRIGVWRIVWESSGESYRIRRWLLTEETRSQSRERFYADMTRQALGANDSYHSQMLHGADYWRTILDGSCGIDIYGHNGISMGDLCGNGLDDLYVCQPAGLPNRLYRNNGDGTFDDVTESSGLGLLANSACALVADFDNDGKQEIVVVRANGPLYFGNEGGGRFRAKKDAFQFSTLPKGTFTGAAAADYNRDGRLDIYFCLYTYYQGADQYRYPTPYFAAENGPPNFLMHNNGDGTFVDVTERSGMNRNNSRFSFCSGWGDSNGDGWPDLYVVNDFGRKNLYVNNHDGTFRDVAASEGAQDVGAGMSVSWLDYNNDGAADLYVANMWTAAGERITNDDNFQRAASAGVRQMYQKHAMGNSLLRNAGARYSDVTATSNTGVGRWAWSSDTFDFDHDGFADVYVTNGMISGPCAEDLNSFFWRQVVAHSPETQKSDPDYERGWNSINELIRSDYSWSGYERNVLFANNGDGTFSDISGAVGLDFIEDGRAFALADLDGDGRQEIVIKNRNAPQLRLMRNIANGLPPAISFRLQGTKSNRDAIGATISVITNTGKQTKSLQVGSGFLSQHSKEVFVGLGEATGRIDASIRWPSGLIQELKNLAPEHRYSVIEGTGISNSEPFRNKSLAVSDEPEVVGNSLPERVGTWLLSPIKAPDTGAISALKVGKPVLLTFSSAQRPADAGVDLQILHIDTSDSKNSEVCGIYNLVFRHLFDRHVDLPLPSSFLLDEACQIVKIYQGEISLKEVVRDVGGIPRSLAARFKAALPFQLPGQELEFERNYLSLGSICFQAGYLEASGEFFRAALNNDGGNAEALYGLGSVYLRQNDNARAKECFEKVTHLPASYPETLPNAWNNLGLIAIRGDDQTSAKACFQRALKEDSSYFTAMVNLGNVYKQEKSWDEAEKTLAGALAIKPTDPEANYSLGMVYAQTGDTPKAFSYLQKALAERPAYKEALNNLGVLYLRTHHPNNAVITFKECISVAPESDQAYLNLARVYAIEGDTEKAKSVLRALLVQHPGHLAAQQALEELH